MLPFKYGDKVEGHYERLKLCPECDERVNSGCRCAFSHRECSSGHQWHTRNGLVVRDSRYNKYRVQVSDGSGKNIIGYGTLVAEVTTWAFHMSDGSICSEHDAEKVPSSDTIKEIYANGGTLVSITNNPKIVMDDGVVKYGCQVWWGFIDADPS